MKQIVSSVDVAFGLAFDVKKTNDAKSGFRPAQFAYNGKQKLFSDLRLQGFIALLEIGFARQLIIVGGNEKLYEGETPLINRADAICRMLVHDFGIDPNRVSAIASGPSTDGNISAIAAYVRVDRSYAVVSNFYHLPRIDDGLKAENLVMSIHPAEAFLLLKDEGKWKNDLVKRFDGGPFAKRVVQEIQGIADKLRGTYKS